MQRKNYAEIQGALADLTHENERLRAALQNLVDASAGDLSDVDGALYEARKILNEQLATDTEK